VPAAVAALVQALGNPRERIAAIQIILDRVYGKAIQPIASQDGAPNVLHLLAARLVSSDLLQELGARPTAASTEPQPAIIDLRAIPPALE
jgi:hypothetical protein